MAKKDNTLEDQQRRDFFAQSWTWVKLFAAGVLCVPVLRFLNFKPPRKPRLVEIHKTVKPGGFLIEQDFILFEGESGPWAVSRKCTHLGCRVNFHEQENLLLCPCHQSRFSITGQRISGPAKRNLTSFQVARMNESEGSGYIVTL